MPPPVSEAGGALQELGRLSQWVLWRYETRDDKRTKVPYAAPGRKAAVDNPHSWTTYDRARAAAAEFDGLGFVFTGTAYCGIDLDHCVDDAGTVESWARAIVQRFNSYTERSPSGRGLHIWIRGQLPGEQRGRRRNGLGPTGAGGVELYSTGRYFTITGDRLPETPATIHARQPELDRFFDEMFPPLPVPAARPMLEMGRAEGMVLTDRFLLDKAMRAKNGEAFHRLWTGDWSGYGSQSEADGALCAHLAFWTGRDPGRMDRLFRASGLIREKWDERRGAETYGALTVAHACNLVTSNYDPARAEVPSTPPRATPPPARPTGPAPAAEAVAPRGNAEVTSLAAVAPEWPTLNPAALYGLPGQIVRTIAPHSEADPVAILLHTLVSLGALIGAGPHARVEHDAHPARLNVVCVGKTGKGRKGLSWSTPRAVVRAVDPALAIASGLSTGEGLIYHVRDPHEQADPETGERVVHDPGVADKRLLIMETEFATVLGRMSRDGNTLSAILRDAWDHGTLRTLVKNAPLTATGAHVAVMGHITHEELVRLLTDVSMANGFGNRFLWACVKRSQFLPDGAGLDDAALAPLIAAVAAVQAGLGTGGRLTRDAEAAAIWHDGYAELSRERDGLVGALLGRAEAQVLRLSVLYAVLDRAPSIRPAHLEAALAVWAYCEQSVLYLFGPRLGHPVADAILDSLRRAGRMTRTQIRDLFGRHKGAEQIEAALGTLAQANLAHRTVRETGGRPEESWEPV